MQAWVQKEAMSLLRLQDALEESVGAQTGSDTDEGEDALPNRGARRTQNFKLPRRLRGWLLLKRGVVLRKEWTAILQFTRGSYGFKQVRHALLTLYPGEGI